MKPFTTATDRRTPWAVLFLAGATAVGCLGPVEKRPRPAPGASDTSVREIQPRSGALVRVPENEIPSFQDDDNLDGLRAAAQRSLGHFEKLPPDRTVDFGGDLYSAREMAAGFRSFLDLLDTPPDQWNNGIKERFTVYRSVGTPPRGQVVFSSYYEHSLRASLKPTKRFRFPLYARPPDLVETKNARGESVVTRQGGGPYWSREDIDSQGRLKGRGLEIAWAEDPVEIFFLQVQGSGWLLLPDGRRWRVRYAGHNGLPYRSVGGHMIERGLLDRASFSRNKMVSYLATHPDKRQGLLNVNPRYVFFRIDRSEGAAHALGSLGVPLVPRRSIATDPLLFPPGALAWMETTTKNKTARFVLNQDQGGAIKGPGRVDYFVGGGEDAQSYAVGFWEEGRLYFLAPARGGQRSDRP